MASSNKSQKYYIPPHGRLRKKNDKMMGGNPGKVTVNQLKNDENESKEEENIAMDLKKLSLTPDIINAKWEKAFGDAKHVVLPVIHVSNPLFGNIKNVYTSIEININLVIKHKFHGCFLINHGFHATELVPIIKMVRKNYPKLWIGANFLGVGVPFDFMKVHDLLNDLDGLWVDNGLISYGIKVDTDKIKLKGAVERLKKYQESKWNGLYFGGVDFKYLRQIKKNDFEDTSGYVSKCKKLAQTVSENGFMDCVCTTGKGTGKAADMDKMKAFREGCDVGKSRLSIASGVTPENVASYLPYVDAILVATGISRNFHNLSDFKMKQMREKIDAYYKKNTKTTNDE